MDAENKVRELEAKVKELEERINERYLDIEQILKLLQEKYPNDFFPGGRLKPR